MEASALLNGTRMALSDAFVAVTDEGFTRGDGAFETCGVWGGRPFQLDGHLRRLASSLAAAGLPPPDLDQLAAEARLLLADVEGDAALRLYVTASDTRLLVLTEQPRRDPVRRLVSQQAPWIRPLGSYGPAGAKTMSYLPNMASTRAARAAGGDDALLVSLEGWVLEGPTFAVLWLADERLHSPPPSLGIIDSLSRRALLAVAAEAGVEAVSEPRPLEHLLAADEVMICSSVRDVPAVSDVDGTTFDGPTPVRDLLSAGLDAARRA
jgi:branched-subunit amino acid aminotransferase/4-amino-4-deoxychorismate lyase